MVNNYDEPWTYETGTALLASGGFHYGRLVTSRQDSFGYLISSSGREQLTRAAECVNALAGVPDETVQTMAERVPEIDPTLRQLALAVLTGDTSAIYPLVDRVQEVLERPVPAEEYRCQSPNRLQFGGRFVG